jgi:hypothetical protein
MRVLVAGWFSFSGMGATAGDLLSRDVTTGWLTQAGIQYDIATVPAFGDGLDWRDADPSSYTHVVFVCGPFGNGPPLVEFLDRFRQCRLFGLNLSMLEALEQWNPFEALFERDSTRTVRPDLSLLHTGARHPVAGLILINAQAEYGHRDRHVFVNRALERVLDAKKILKIPIDTCLEDNAGKLTSPVQIEALISRMDFVATTRLHGLVLALKNDVPVLAVDSVAGEAKVSRQAMALGWPAVIGASEVSDKRLAELCAYCLSPEARIKARECTARAIRQLAGLRDDLLAAVMRRRTSSSKNS